MSCSELPSVLFLTGAVGVGKTDASYRVFSRSWSAGIQTARLDIDDIGMCHPAPADDPDNHRAKAAMLAAAWPVFRDREVLTPATVSRNLPFVAAYRSKGEPVGFEALGDRTRLAIVEVLSSRPHTVGEVAAKLPISRPAVSQHLKVLKDAGLVSERAEGTRRIYRLNPAGVAALRDQLDTFWARALAAYEGIADNQGG